MHPEIREIIGMASHLGFYNIVSSNMTRADPLREVDDSFAYEVSIYGVSREEYREYTGRDLFHNFMAQFVMLFGKYRTIGASIRVDQQWRARLPRFLRWLKGYPLSKLRISNTIAGGRNVLSAVPLGARDLDDIRDLVSAVGMPFPVVLPSVETSHRIHKGYILIGPPEEVASIASVNGCPVECISSLRAAITRLATNNVALFTMDNYL